MFLVGDSIVFNLHDVTCDDSFVLLVDKSVILFGTGGWCIWLEAVLIYCWYCLKLIIFMECNIGSMLTSIFMKGKMISE